MNRPATPTTMTQPPIAGEVASPSWRLLTKRDLTRTCFKASAGDAELESLKRRIRQSPWQGNSGDKVPRNNHWRPYGLFSAGELLAVTTTRFSRNDHCLEVQTCQAFASDTKWRRSIAEALITFLLCDAFRCGERLVVRFIHMQKGGKIRSTSAPEFIRNAAGQIGVDLPHADAGIICPKSGSLLLLKLASIGDECHAVAMGLEASGRVAPGRIASQIFQGRWTAADIQMLLLGCDYPELVLEQVTSPLVRAPNRIAIRAAKHMIMGQLTDYLIATQSEHVIHVSYDSIAAEKVYSCDEPWNVTIPPGWDYVDCPSLVVTPSISVQDSIRVLLGSEMCAPEDLSSLVLQINSANTDPERHASSPCVLVVSQEWSLAIASVMSSAAEAESRVQGFLVMPVCQADLQRAAVKRLRGQTGNLFQ